MRKLIAAAGLAVGIIGGAHMSSAEAQSTELCGDVYNAVDQGDHSSLLQQQIGSFAANGVEVHIQIVDDGGARGINSEDDALRFAEKLYDDCDWPDKDVVDIVLAVDTHKGNVWRAGQANNDISASDVEAAKQDFVTNLRDTSTSYESDSAQLLKDINPYESTLGPETGGTHDKPTDSTPAKPNEPFRMPDLPYEGIGIGLLGTGTLVAGGLRVKRGRDVFGLHAQTIDAADTAEVTIELATATADSLLAIIHDDDALDERNQRKTTGDALDELYASEDSMRALYATQRRRLWPSLSALKDEAKETGKLINAGNSEAATLTEKMNTLQGRIGTIDETIDTFSGLINTLEATIVQLESQGWDLSDIRARLSSYQQTRDEIVQLKDQNYVDKPADMADAIDDTIVADTELATKLPERMSDNQQKQQEQAANTDTVTTAIQTATTQLDSLKAKYDASCTENIATHSEEMARLLQVAKDYQTSVGTLVNVKSSADVASTEETQAAIAATFSSIDALVAETANRAQLLAELEASLPQTYEQLVEASQDGITFARANFGDDTEPDTYAALEALHEEVLEVQRGLSADKPKLLELQASVSRLDDKQEQLDNRAHEEAAEMKQLRANIADLSATTHEKLDSLKDYIRNHSDVDHTTESTARDIELLHTNTSAGRISMREQVEELKQIEAKIKEALSDAKRDVQQAEAERERAREAQRAAERAQEAARQASANAAMQAQISNNSSGGGNSSGTGVSW
jgi:chromosome segregation ATPase